MSVAMSEPTARLRRRSISSSATSVPTRRACRGRRGRSARRCGSRAARVHLVEAREVVGRLDDERDGAGVGEVPLTCAAARLVDRHEHGAREPRGEVDERPLVACLAHEADLVAGLDAGGDEALREGDHLVVELPGRDRGPAAVGGGEREQDRVGSRRNASTRRSVAFASGSAGTTAGSIEFDHGSSFGTGEARAAVGARTSALGSTTL